MPRDPFGRAPRFGEHDQQNDQRLPQRMRVAGTALAFEFRSSLRCTTRWDMIDGFWCAAHALFRHLDDPTELWVGPPRRCSRKTARWGVSMHHIDWSKLLPLSPAPVLGTLALAWLYLSAGRETTTFAPYASAAAAFLAGYLGLALSIAPYVAPYQLTLWDCAAKDNALALMLVGVVIMLRVILGYTAFVYWIFRGKAKAEHGYHSTSAQLATSASVVRRPLCRWGRGHDARRLRSAQPAVHWPLEDCPAEDSHGTMCQRFRPKKSAAFPAMVTPSVFLIAASMCSNL